MGLQGTRQQGHTVDSVRDAMADLHETYLNAGAHEMVNLLFHERGMSIARRQFWAAGVNDLFAVDQHDKWLKYGLGLHTGIEPFSGRIMWIRLILSYYLDKVKTLGHMPMVTQSDPGSKNFGIANAHTMLCQRHDPALQGTLQHRWMRSKKNLMPEIMWSQLRHRFTPGFKALSLWEVNTLKVNMRNPE
ncbi:hypothetical protein EDB19DRAFT_1894566 [Suillus lakei]|nr:hypothetical protein EDB19DRAFT_1894566 [Suillus lakei]